jgi:hypothetical protein
MFRQAVFRPEPDVLHSGIGHFDQGNPVLGSKPQGRDKRPAAARVAGYPEFAAGLLEESRRFGGRHARFDARGGVEQLGAVLGFASFAANVSQGHVADQAGCGQTRSYYERPLRPTHFDPLATDSSMNTENAMCSSMNSGVAIRRPLSVNGWPP